MWESLPAQFQLLIEDCLPHFGNESHNLRMLDIGCGTGLATEMILNTKIGRRIQSIDLLDSSPSMLHRVRERISRRQKPVECHQGYLDSLRTDKRFDLIVTSSVLHHVPDLASFLRGVCAIQTAGGVFLHIQDPNGDYLNDAQLQNRMAEQSQRRRPSWTSRFTPPRLARSVFNRITGRRGAPLAWKTNRSLLERGILASPLSTNELYSITDIHVQNGEQEGIRISRMQKWLPDYDCISQRSYGFFGELWSTLPPSLQKIEEQLIADRALNGFHVGAAWKLRPTP
jgi:SAM-dependent methyltransferase